MTTTERLSDCYLFRGLDDELLGPVHELVRVEHYHAQDLIFDEHVPAADLYHVVEGRVAVAFTFPYHLRPLRVNITVVGPGGVFGWSALTGNARYSAQARAETECTVLGVNGAKLRALMDRDPRLGYAVMTHLSKLISTRFHDALDHLRVLLSW